MVARTRRRGLLRIVSSLAPLLASACALPPTRHSKTVWAEPPVDAEQGIWQLASATCSGGSPLPSDQLTMVLRVRGAAGGPRVLEIESGRFTCREQLVLALSPSPSPNLFRLEEQSRTSGASCAPTKEPPRVVSFVQERRTLVLTGPVSALCGSLNAELVFVPGPS